MELNNFYQLNSKEVLDSSKIHIFYFSIPLFSSQIVWEHNIIEKRRSKLLNRSTKQTTSRNQLINNKKTNPQMEQLLN